MSSRTIGIFVGVVLLGLLGFLVYKQNQKVDAIGKPTAASSADLPTISAPDDIDKISITNGDKGEVLLEKQGDTWMITKPIAASANQQSAKDAVTNIKDWKIKEVVNLKLDDDLKKDKQLDPGHAVHVVAWKGGDKKTDVSFGKAGSAGQLVMVDGKPDQVWAATGYSSYLFTREAKDWRAKEICKFDDTNAANVTLTNKSGACSFTRGDKGWAGTFKGNAIAGFDEQKVKDLLRDVKALSAEDFGDGKTDADTGLGAPLATLTVNLKDGAGTYTVAVGGVAKDTSHYARRVAPEDPDHTVFVIGKTASDWALADPPKFQKAPDAGAPDAGKK
jgi:hypothetical protein